jgi:8-oxo-dGTP pyrophosphatase MutT (NUDIX family)
MSKRWTVLSSRVIHEGRPHRLRLDTCRTPAGVMVRDYFVREVADIAMVFAVTPDRRVVLVRQYRHGAGEETLELPQGLFEPGEDFLAAGARELAEETGYEAASLTRIGDLLASPAVQTSRLHVLFATGARPGRRLPPDPEEDIEISTVPIGDVLPLIAGGRLRAAGSVAGALLALGEIARRGEAA